MYSVDTITCVQILLLTFVTLLDTVEMRDTYLEREFSADL